MHTENSLAWLSPRQLVVTREVIFQLTSSGRAYHLLLKGGVPRQ